MKRSLAVISILIALFGAILLSQNTALVTGTVTDQTGAVIPFVSVEIRSAATGAVLTARADQAGHYSFNVTAGTYEITVAATGFKKVLQKNIVVADSGTVRVDIKLEVGGASDVVTVATAATPLIQKDGGAITQNVTIDQADHLPVLTIGQTGAFGATQAPLQILNLLPGTQFPSDTSAFLGAFNAAVRVNGQPNNSESIRVEGQDTTNGIWRGGSTMTQQGVDAISEIPSQPQTVASLHLGPNGVPQPPITPRSAPHTGPGTAEYETQVETGFSATAANPLSTFAADVDTASYSNVRRFLKEGHLPPPGAVRVEELVNYFHYDYPLPEAGKPVSFTTHYMSDPWNPQRKLLLVGLRTKPISSEELPPTNLTFLLDVSGSMEPAERLPLIKESMKMLTRQLRHQDRVSIVVYAGAAGVVLPPTPGDHHGEIIDALDRLHAGGSTNGADGIRLAYQMARQSFAPGGNNRVILATDGDFNVGVSSDDEMIQLIERERASGVFLSVLGVGNDNLKDAKMEKIADHGNGNYAYIDNLQEAYKVLIQQMGGTLVTVAKDVKLQVEFNPVYVKGWRMVGYEDRALRPEDFNNDRKDAGDLGAGHQVTAIYEIIPSRGESLQSVDPLRYQGKPPAPHGPLTPAARSNELAWVKVRHKAPQSDTSELLEWPVPANETAFQTAPRDTRFAVAVAEYGLLLQKSQFAGGASFDHVLRTAADALGPDLDGYRAEFLGLVQRAHGLSGY